ADRADHLVVDQGADRATRQLYRRYPENRPAVGESAYLPDDTDRGGNAVVRPADIERPGIDERAETAGRRDIERGDAARADAEIAGIADAAEIAADIVVERRHQQIVVRYGVTGQKSRDRGL